jgi:flagellar protein FliS
MSTVNPYLKQYQKSQIETATPEQVLIMLYDGAIQYLNKARIAIEEKDGVKCQNNLFACEKILVEFMNTLDMERGGELAKNLLSLYKYLYDVLIKVNFSKDLKKLDEVLKHLKSLRETWQKAIIIANAEKEVNILDDNNDYSDEDSYSTQQGLLSSDDDEDEYEAYDEEDDDDDDDEY